MCASVFSVVQIFTKFVGINTKDFCILIFLIAIACSLFAKGVLFKSSNSIWFAITIFSYAIFMALTIFYKDLADFYAFVFLALPAIFAGVVVFIYREWIYLKIGIFLIFVSVPVLLFNLKLIEIWLFIILLVAFGVVGYLLQMLLKFNKNS